MAVTSTMNLEVHLVPSDATRQVLIALGWTPPSETVDLAPNPVETASLYRERAALVAHLAAVYPSALVYGADPSAPDWPVIFIDTPHGQLSWHLATSDIDLFGHVPVWTAETAGVPVWDGHTTAEKYERLAACVKDTALDQRYAT